MAEYSMVFVQLSTMLLRGVGPRGAGTGEA